MSDNERLIRARIAQLTELLTELEDESTFLHALMGEHYDNLEYQLEETEL